MTPPASDAIAMAADRDIPSDPDDPATRSGRVHGAPHPQLERVAERQADPEDEAGGDHDRRGRQQEQRQQRCGAEDPHERELAGGPRSEATGKSSQQVGHERRRRQRRQTHGVQAATAGDRRQKRHDERQTHAHADGADHVEGEIPPDLAPVRAMD